MTPEQIAALQAELTVMKRKAAKRRDEPGFAANVAQMDAWIADVEAFLAAAD